MIEQMDVLERVNSIFIDTNKFYCLHDNYISEWSFELGACIAVIRICNPKCMVKVDNSLLVAGPYQDVIEIKDGEYKARETSMKSVTSLCQFGTLIVEGGADNLIDIRTPAMRIVTLYS